MVEKTDDSLAFEMFVTEFPKQGFGIVDYLQGRVHFAILDQMKLMSKSGMSQTQIKENMTKTITEIIDSFEPEKESENS